MSTRRKSVGQRQVHPAASALLILMVFGGVQFVWWRFLVYRPVTNAPGQMSGGGRAGEPDVHISGRADVYVRTFTGDEKPGAVDGAPHAARFDRPTGLALDGDGNLYVADTGNHRIRKVAPDGETTTLAGGELGYADGAVEQAKFNSPCGVCMGPDGTLFVADTGNHCIRKIKGGQVSTLGCAGPAGGFPTPGKLSAPVGIAVVPGPPPSLLVADAAGSLLARFSIDGTPQGDRKLPGGPVGVTGAPEAVAIPSSGTVILGEKTLKNIPFSETDEVPADNAAKLILKRPVGVIPWGSNWLVTDNDHGALFMIVDGKARVLAGYCSTAGPIHGFHDGNGQLALFGNLGGIVSDGKQFVYVSDTANNSIRRVDISELNSN